MRSLLGNRANRAKNSCACSMPITQNPSPISVMSERISSLMSGTESFLARRLGSDEMPDFDLVTLRRSNVAPASRRPGGDDIFPALPQSKEARLFLQMRRITAPTLSVAPSVLHTTSRIVPNRAICGRQCGFQGWVQKLVDSRRRSRRLGEERRRGRDTSQNLRVARHGSLVYQSASGHEPLEEVERTPQPFSS